jgi:hypothetical protein
VRIRTELFIAVMLVFIGSFSSVARADDLTLSYTFTGHGGVSQPIAGFSSAPFLFVDNTGGVSNSVLFAYGIPDVFGGFTTGSVILSSPFELSADESINVTTSFLSLDGPHYDWGAVYLLSNDLLAATLYTVSAGGSNQDFQGNEVTLGGIAYGPYRTVSGAGGLCTQLIPDVCALGGSTPWVTSSDTPGAGEYQLLFVSYNTIDVALPSALAIQSVTTPEPATVVLLAIGFVVLLGFAECKRFIS